MKNLFVAAICIIALFTAQSVNGQVKNNDVAEQAPSSEQSIEIAKAEANNISETTEDLSGCNAQIHNPYNNYCGSYKITYDNTCNKRIYVKIWYTTSPNEGYSGRTEQHTWSGYLRSNCTNMTLIDCNRTTNVRLDDYQWGDWED